MAHERNIGLAAAALLACAASTAAAQAPESRLSAYLTIASDYRRYGLSQSDGHAAAQVGVDYEHARGWFLGGWVSTVDFEAEEPLEDQRRTEIDLYAGYDFERDDWGATITAARYRYPGGPPYTDYDELSAGMRFRDRLFATVSRTSGIGARE
ncbi:MAG TPA: TorF family putative porin, partial [Gammaproteobacteria bacterium]|nr:TorF family putative porin [Gammaproteobacteria bacterium]